MENEIKLSIMINPKDMFRFLMRHFYTHFSGIFGVILSLGALVVFFLNIGKGEPTFMIALFIMASLFTVLQPIQFWVKANQRVKLNPMFKEPLLYTMNSEGITVEQKEDNVLLPWKDVRSIIESKNAIFVYSSSVNAFILPKKQLGQDVQNVKEIMKANTDKNICKLK
ncbi:YcxB family protein [Velocimicrobium porci]|uniref:YcxB family protein n=1 Tax=Velocimicrobium porci TaxID=2606634 RepID=A0A6L5XYG6_9FIRM|nr:YcxB family protein [Velocimicrobium porci]MSS63802.1 YcxB family protein [Velocimicrobium porci]